MQQLLAFACLQSQKVRQGSDAEQKDAASQSAVIATERHIAEANLDLEQCLEFIVDQARRITGADGAAIAIREGDEFICRGSAGVLAPDPGTRVDPQSGISGACLRTGELQQCDDTKTDFRVDPAVCRRQGIQSVLVVPIRRREVLGIVALFSGLTGAFTDRDVRILSELTALVSARLPARDAAEVACVSGTETTALRLDPTEECHPAEFTSLCSAGLPPTALAVREQAAFSGLKALKAAVLAVVLLAVTSEAVLWRGLHVNKVLRTGEALLVTAGLGAAPHQSTPSMIPSAATIPPAQTDLATLPAITPAPLAQPDLRQARPPKNAPGEKAPSATPRMPPDKSLEPSAITNPPDLRFDGPDNLHFLSTGLGNIPQLEVINPIPSTSVSIPKDARNLPQENGKRAALKHKKAEPETNLQHTLQFRGVVNTRYTYGRLVVDVRFAIYAQPQGGAPFWQEVQSLEADQLGNFTAEVGSTSAGGLPPFALQGGFWLGWRVQLPGEVERPRIWLVSTPSGLIADGTTGRMIARDSIP